MIRYMESFSRGNKNVAAKLVRINGSAMNCLDHSM